jgi:hypothetical protein
MPQPSYTPEEVARRGRELYETSIREKVEAGNQGKVIVIDIESGDYEIDPDHLTAAERALAKNPDAVLYATRVGFRALGRIGGPFAVKAKT